MDSYLFYASATLVVMGLIAVALAISLRLRFKKWKILSKNSVASVFNKSFVVFDPYEQKTIFHRLLTLLAFVPLIIGLGAVVLFLEIISSDLLLTLLVLIVALGLIVVEELPEVYAESKNLIKAIHGGSSLGVCDLKLLQLTKKLLPRLSLYYVGLSAFLLHIIGNKGQGPHFRIQDRVCGHLSSLLEWAQAFESHRRARNMKSGLWKK